MNKKEWIYGGIILILFVLLMFRIIPDLEIKKHTDKITENIILPECYIAQSNKCPLLYHKVEMLGSHNSGFVQCCRGNEYILQGIDVDLINHYMGRNTWTKSIFDVYNCSFKISEKLYCTAISDCYDRPNLKGCSKTFDGCNTCCNGWCTLMACIGFEYNFTLGIK